VRQRAATGWTRWSRVALAKAECALVDISRELRGAWEESSLRAASDLLVDSPFDALRPQALRVPTRCSVRCASRRGPDGTSRLSSRVAFYLGMPSHRKKVWMRDREEARGGRSPDDAVIQTSVRPLGSIARLDCLPLGCRYNGAVDPDLGPIHSRQPGDSRSRMAQPLTLTTARRRGPDRRCGQVRTIRSLPGTDTMSREERRRMFYQCPRETSQHHG
jgi:hypothetical protein